MAEYKQRDFDEFEKKLSAAFGNKPSGEIESTLDRLEKEHMGDASKASSESSPDSPGSEAQSPQFQIMDASEAADSEDTLGVLKLIYNELTKIRDGFDELTGS